ncbi:NDP-sugar epimerase, includes UDP-GlcNAc-inverting 4,6-dehydratase FlaA1 and capsular polysaccharide biosynthesis protein EpsC [Pseudomonas delhiensis]|uniref:NDP-sugar epimerase, includes UDP-GlcNAc-inverting 4,6-dehydratase FlaA1 and capsular polysaccharide biosynthesis protein EpsC n=2 Tax=Pseudomonas delhiensis TaxID=366289 RepID=A0A239MQ97_9PSED|nr:NDP-sugar epimerase, includes UDP-GlcNAc-inverting 4,6-dehydratase FlaA1 and capsular polysaccharide biosynthesis protein EpsC [Pseudomonas delhiensis]SNT44292.1 NDP-sugar epimerase, includes UDP-GlcNAc-inverting 4,6-dehydratase FlaA1 and capsular polysaccharide biosynthesis protein EpsC [Pseudomonas delhiensis]
MLRERLLRLPRRYKRMLQVVTDVFLVWLALWLSFVVRLGADDLTYPFRVHAWLFIAAPLIAIPLFIRFGMYRAVMRYLGNDALIAIWKAVTISALVLSLVVYWNRSVVEAVPRSLVLNYWWLSLLMVGGLRLAMRQYFMGDWYSAVQAMPFFKQDDGLTKVAVYGAGTAGNQLVAALRLGRAMRPVAFIDDDDEIANRVIAGLRVFKPKHIQQMIEETGAQEILLAIPSASRARRREILGLLEPYPLHVRSVPGIIDLANGRVRVDDIQEVDIADLLGRDPVAPRKELLEHCIRGQAVMVTGAGGSIGSELCRQILTCGPTVMVLFEHCEFNLYRIHQELERRIRRESLPVQLVPILGSVRSAERLLEVLGSWKINTVYHAAAYKHVPIVEHNISEGVLNNVLGTLQAAQASIQAGVQNFVLISTDKAVRPTNVMGGTKRLAEMILQALSQEQAPVLFGDKAGVHHVNKTRFTMVRFGNVLGSSGSVIPLFREQIKRGGPVTVTHPAITRYFMTIPEAAQLVIQAGSMGRGGDVFVLDMGQPVKILELAQRMIHLSGLSVRSESTPHGDIAIEFSGLRPGEKLYEELLIGDDVGTTEHPMIMKANEEMLPWDAFKAVLGSLLKAVERGDYAQVRMLLRDSVNGYCPDGDIVDLVHQQRRMEP